MRMSPEMSPGLEWSLDSVTRTSLVATAVLEESWGPKRGCDGLEHEWS